MRIQHPNPTVTLSVAEVTEAVEMYIKGRNEMPDAKRLGNMVHAELTTMANVVGTSRQAGQITFELIPESAT